MTFDVQTALDPQVGAALAQLPIGSIDWSVFTLESIPTLRAAFPPVPEPPPSTTVEHTDHTVPGPAGAPDVAVRVYTPIAKTNDPRPCLYWIHGGGYIFGSALQPELRLERWAEQLDAVIVSVDYRLAPEHPYPAPLDDCYAGLVWTAKNTAELGIDPDRIAIGGASAGGGLAAGLALLARDRGEVAFMFQLLVYPMIDDRSITPSSGLAGAPVWNPDSNRLGWHAYLGREPGGDDVPAFAAAARATDAQLATLPPVVITVGSLDVFRDEDIDYARRLLGAGVPTELHVYPGAPHGFEMFAPAADVSIRCNRDLDGALQRAFQRG